MSLFTMLESILIGPLKLVFEIIFTIANRFIGHPGLAIIFLSLVMNILVLPLYRRADAMQEEARDIDAKMRDGVAHIKKKFTGDERMMILQTYYRQNNYSPVSALNGSVSLFLEIPFFMAAYQFLSHLEILDGVALGPITNLGAPDGLIVIGGLTINLLPILMTLINVISSAIYLKGFPLKTKIQLYAMALFFLVFLYNSPACLVFYWTLNNVFSLVKNIFYKLKNPQKVLQVLTALLGVLILLFVFFVYRTPSIRRKVFLAVIGLVLILPLFLPLLKKILPASKETEATPNKTVFLLGSLFLTVLVGLLIPSTFIAASPQEYIDISYFHNPMWYIVSATCLSVGTFMVWMRVFYWLANDTGKAVFDKLVWILCGIMLVNYMFFGTELGIIFSNLQYEFPMTFSAKAQLVNLVTLAVLAVVMYLIALKWNRSLTMILLTGIIAFSAMSGYNIYKAYTPINDAKLQAEALKNDFPHFNISTKGKNVVVVMLDRAMGQYVPYLFNENKDLEKSFKGFTYYSNTISFGGSTNFGTPTLYGGYEYTPVEMNKRDTELLVDKHNEALLLMPVLFSENGYHVTACDPVYANYSWIPDLSIFDPYPDIKTYITDGRYGDTTNKASAIEKNYRNFFCFSIMKCMPLFIQPTIYNEGMYNQAVSPVGEVVYSVQVAESPSVANGYYEHFMEPYNTLVNMSNMTNIVEDSTNTFMYISNDITHNPVLLQAPDYVPTEHVDNTRYDAEHTNRFTVDGKTMRTENLTQMSHYHTNMATLIQMGKWFDYLRENDAYDNTRIILVADHGYPLYQFDELIHGDTAQENVEYYYPLLMVKDFDAQKFTTCDDFMTIADVPTLAMEGLIQNPINPFTGKEINTDEKTSHAQYVLVQTDISKDWDVTLNNGTTFKPARWASIKDNIWIKDNWIFYNDVTVLSEHAAP